MIQGGAGRLPAAHAHEPGDWIMLTRRLALMLAVLAWSSTAAVAEEVAQAPSATTAPAAQATATTTADHSKFKELAGPFATGPEVTKACLQCHTEAAHQIQQTTHWTWAFRHPTTGQELGKRNVVNNFCVATATNWPRCTSCHVGYGWKDDTGFDFAAQQNVDCVVCHDTTGTYKKFPTGAGHPTYEPKEFPPGSGKVWQPPDLAKIAQNVGPTSRQTCGACHFYGGGGDAVKHGDLDSTMAMPSRALDVHMAPDGLNFQCSTCHTTGSHQVTGSRYVTKAVDRVGIDVPGHTDDTRATCESCHGMVPHEDAKVNDHTDVVACPTCHVPEFARGGKKTKMWWDWSTAGKLDDAGKPFTVGDGAGNHTYDSAKGDFVWEANVVPEYRWFDGEIRYTLLGDTIDPAGVVPINTLGGGPGDPDSRIWPFKIMRGRQPYDAGTNILAVPHLFGKDENAFWGAGRYDWNKAIAVGMQARDVTYSGSYGFVETEYAWPITHMVAPKDQALECESCHAENGRLATLGGFYMPGAGHHGWLGTVGWSLAGLTLLGTLVHALLRVLGARRQR